VCILVLLLYLQFREVYTETLPQQFRFLLQAFEQCFFVKTQRTPTQTDTTILSVYSLSLVTIITGHLILTKNSESERFVHFVARERQSDSPQKTSTLHCQMQAQRPTFYIDCRKIKLRLLLLFCAIVLYLLVYHVCCQDGKLCLLVANGKLDGK
jgi:hypothetical protein